MRILVTGANSFVGRSLIPSLSLSGIDVAAVWNRTKPNYLLPDKTYKGCIELFQGNLANWDTYKSLPTDIDAIVHIAAISYCNETVYEYIDSNVIPVRHLIKYCNLRKINKFIYFSSLSIYGNVCENVVSESTPIRDPDIYGISKYIGELLLNENRSIQSSVAIRLPGIVGPNAHRHWLANVLKRAILSENITIYNPGAKFNNAVHVDDLAKFISTLLNSTWTGFHAMPVGSDGYITINDVVSLIINHCKSKSVINIVDEKLNSFTISSKYAQDIFNYCPSNIIDTIIKYVDENIEKHP